VANDGLFTVVLPNAVAHADNFQGGVSFSGVCCHCIWCTLFV